MLPTQNTIRDLLGYIAFEIDQARSDLEKWGAWFNQNPHAALMGASHAMGYAAQLKLWTEIQELAEPHRKDGLCYNDLCRTIATYLHDDMLGKARHPSSSSLQSANLMSQADLTAVTTAYLYFAKQQG